MKDVGSKLFDIWSSHHLNKINDCKNSEIPEAFDSEHYLDQLDPSKKKKFIHVTIVTKEYMGAEQQKQLILEKRMSCELSPRGVNPEVGGDNIQNGKSDANDGGNDGEEENNVKSHDVDDNDEDYREAPLNVSAEEVLFTKEIVVSSLLSKEQDRKNSWFLYQKGLKQKFWR